MIGTIRKHSAWLWAIVITATVASFVIAYRPGNRGGNQSSGKVQLGYMYNEPINQIDYVSSRKETELSYFLSRGEWPDRPGHQTDFDTEKETYFRLFLIQKAADLHINVASEDVIAEAREKLRSLSRGEAIKVDVFEKQILQPRGLTVEDLERTVQHELEIRQLFVLLGSSGGLVTPQEAHMLYLRENTDVSAQVVFFSVSNYLSQVMAPPEAVAQFYTNQAAYYRLPERVQVTYVEFPLTNYWEAAGKEMAAMTNIDLQFDQYTMENGTNYFRGASNPAEARTKFHSAFHERQAGILANKDAYDFANQLFDLKPTRADNLASLAKQKGLTVKTTEPFDSRTGPKEFYIPLQFVQAAFHLTEDEPYTTPITGDLAVYVMALDKRLPSEVPSLESIQGRVASDYAHYRATVMAREATVKFYTTVTNTLAAGKGFPTACLEAHVQPVLLPPFSMRTETNAPEIEAHVKSETLKQAAFSVLPGQAIYAGTEEGGMVLFVDSRLPVNEARMNAELPGFLVRVRQSREQEAFNVWFSHEASGALKDIPALQPKAPTAPR